MILAIAIPAVIAFHPLANNDLPMHLAIGDWIIEHGSVPATDPFSANGHGGPWIAHEWLAALLFAFVFKIGGPHGLVALTVLLSGLLGAMQDRVSRLLGHPPVVRILFLIPLWLIAGRRLMLRPHLLGLCSVIGLWWITLVGRKNPQRLWLAIPLLLLWANWHSSFILGLAFVLFDLLIWPDGHQASLRQRQAIFGGCLLATLCQPHGFDLFLFPFQLGLDPVFTTQVQEWVSPFSGEMGGTLFRQTPTFWVGMPVLLIALLVSLRNGFSRLSDSLPRATCLAIAIAVLMAFMQQRHFALAALLGSVAIGKWQSSLYQKFDPPIRRQIQHRGIISCVLFLLLLITLGYPASIDGSSFGFRWRKPGTGWSKTLPQTPISVLTSQWQVSGPVLCDYEFGSLIVHASAGQLQPTMDSRNTVYGPARYIAHSQALAGPTPEQDRLLELASAVMIRPPDNRGHPQLSQRLATDTSWALIHIGPRCQVWVKKSAVPQKLRSFLEG